MSIENTLRSISLENEQWRPFPYKEISAEYYISSLGRVYSMYKPAKSASYSELPIKEKGLLTTPISKDGYARVFIRRRNVFFKSLLVHRVVAQAFLPNAENKKTVNHKNGNRSDNCVANLEWNTHSENASHGYSNNGRIAPRSIPVFIMKDSVIIEFQSVNKLLIETGIRHELVRKYANTDVDVMGYRIVM